MSIHTNAIVIGSLLASPIAGFLQCDSVEPEDEPELIADTGVSAEFAADDAPEEEVPLESLFDGEAPTARSFNLRELSLKQLGKFVFFDKISVPAKKQGCISCHDPATGWTFPNDKINKGQVAAPGAVLGAVGTIRPPSNAYARNIPLQTGCGPLGLPCGGVFWDGRAEGNVGPVFAGATTHIDDEVFKGKSLLEDLFAEFLGPVADQALQPFPNPFEQNISAKAVCTHVSRAPYALLYRLAWGEKIDCTNAGFMLSFKRIAVALAAWQASDEVNQFSSKRDKALAAEVKLEGANVAFPLKGLTAQENLGHELFYGRANCALCHSNEPVLAVADPNKAGLDPDELYTDATFHNIGVPRNAKIPGPEGSAGLGARPLVIPDPDDDPTRRLGQHKTPTLRNVDKRPYKGFVKAYTHNGWFKSLESLVHFYNTADVDGATAAAFGVTRCDTTKTDWTEAEALAANCWPEPEEQGTLAIGFVMGDLGLTLAEEAAIVAYLKTLTDTKTVKPPPLLE
ncbi:Cytochrome c peroxidase [Nannocystis exedens]|uniref:Cytochrome c peroxidase n=1 Tax=Nannocystis exedens TaxID=54 RepID=A0A1I1XI29_9BACT|nr:cytochrome c peroxidase [Nannocystis exedens]PCC73435.1 Methylamine utilization protein MauG precursor [Nannocystis exedens]SFE06298.1 Cytochrome c peroxidase [Nannocystis exedens]